MIFYYRREFSDKCAKLAQIAFNKCGKCLISGIKIRLNGRFSV
ncbi:hypothetical protein GP5015_307 [gamma proteobacterium HTCC5015]|nr:hypothetical protein GP5015_307 [gamma proteobacterium HTCC5015]